MGKKIPYFNASVYLENKSKIGKVEEIFGGIMDVHFSVKMSDNMKADSFDKGTVFYIDPYKLLPLTRFTESEKPRGGGRGGRGGGSRGGGFGGRGGGRGASRGRGGSRGRF